MHKYHLEFTLRARDVSGKTIKSSLAEFGEGVEVVEDSQISTAQPEEADSSLEQKRICRDFKIKIDSEEPTIVFDVCSQFGRIQSVKIHEEEGRV